MRRRALENTRSELAKALGESLWPRFSLLAGKPGATKAEDNLVRM